MRLAEGSVGISLNLRVAGGYLLVVVVSSQQGSFLLGQTSIHIHVYVYINASMFSYIQALHYLSFIEFNVCGAVRKQEC